MPKRAPDPITEEELNKILDVAIIRERDYLLLRLLARTGIRIGELYGVNKCEQGRWIYGIQKKDIDFRNKSLWVYSLKQEKYVRREVLVDDATIVLLKKYTEKMKPEDYVFRSISYRQIQRLPKKYAQLAESDRSYLILRLLAGTGIRIDELYGVYKCEQRRWIYGIQKKDIDFRNKRLWVYSLKQKRYVRREVLVDDATIVLLKRYTEKMEPEDYVFRSISYRQIQRLPKKYAQLAGVEKNVSCHSLRHFFITHSWRKGIDIARLQYLAGHADLKTTMIYTHVTTEDVEKKYREIYEN